MPSERQASKKERQAYPRTGKSGQPFSQLREREVPQAGAEPDVRPLDRGEDLVLVAEAKIDDVAVPAHSQEIDKVGKRAEKIAARRTGNRRRGIQRHPTSIGEVGLKDRKSTR